MTLVFFDDRSFHSIDGQETSAHHFKQFAAGSGSIAASNYS
jgi:hypothetical protein